MAALFTGQAPPEEDGEIEVKSKPAVIAVSTSTEEPPGAAGSTVPPNGSLPPSAGEGDFDDSTTMILRRYTGDRTRNGRPASFHLGSPLEAVSLSESFRVAGRQCSVQLEEDRMSWAPLKSSRKKTPKETLFLSDIFAVTLETGSTHGPSADPMQFTVHALKSVAGSVGRLTRSTFCCQSSHTCKLWHEQIQHQIQNFGSRPRKLYVVVNPVSGDTRGAAERTWGKARAMLDLAHIHSDVLVTQRRFHAREHMQSLDLAEYDGVIVVGGDGMFNEVLNGLMLQTQQAAGVNLRRARFIPVTPAIRVGLIPTGFANSIARSLLKSQCPLVATAQIMLGCSTPVDVSSISHNGQLLLFSAGPLSYGFWSDTASHSQEFSWLGARRFDAATIKTLLMRRSFEAEISFVPVEEEAEQGTAADRCFNRCPKCSNFDTSLESPTSAHEKGASVMAAYSEPIDRVDDSQWQTLRGQFFSVMSCSHICCSLQAPRGVSPSAHIGNGCTDLIMVSKCSALRHARWLLRQRKGRGQFGQPCVRLQRVKEFRFREILQPTGRTAGEQEELVNSVENLVQEVDEDEATNQRAASAGKREGRGVAMPMSSWNIDGDELPRADIDVRVHRHLLSVFARGLEPLGLTSRSSSAASLPATDQEDAMLSP